MSTIISLTFDLLRCGRCLRQVSLMSSISRCLKFLLTIPVTLFAVSADLRHCLDDYRSAVMVTPRPRSVSSCTDSSSFLPCGPLFHIVSSPT